MHVGTSGRGFRVEKFIGYVPSYPSVRVVRILIKSYTAGERLYVLEALSQTLLAPLTNISMNER